MLFCIMVNYTPQAIDNLMANPETSRLSAVQKVVEGAPRRQCCTGTRPCRRPPLLPPARTRSLVG